MENSTEKKLKDAFIQLLNKKPVKKITVKEIVEECGFNRNTFYYHFTDIPQLLEKIIQDNMGDIAAQYSKIDSEEDCLNSIIDLALKNKNLLSNIYSSANRDLFEMYEWKICEQLAKICIDKKIKGRKIEEKYYQIILSDIKCICFGFIMNWLENGMKEDIYEDIHLLCQIKEGNIEKMIEKSLN